MTCDVFVIFGITGDLAKVMTFRSLYRLEQRKLLDCPIVGVAVDDWTHDQLVDRARTSIVACRGGPRRGGLRAPGQAHVVRVGRLRRRRHLRAGRRRRSRASSTVVYYLEIPPSLFGMVIKGLAGAGLTKDAARRRGEAVRARPGVGARARRRAAPVHRRVTAAAHRPLPREDGARGDPLPALRQHAARAGVEPELRRLACRSRWPRTSAWRIAGSFYDPVGALRDVAVNHLMQVVAAAAMEPPAGGDVETLKDAQTTLFRAVRAGGSEALRARAVRRLPVDQGRRARFDDRDLRRAPARDRELALVRRAVLHPHRQEACDHRDRAAPRVQASPEARIRAERRRVGARPDRDPPRSRHRHALQARGAPGGREDGSADQARHGVQGPGR